MINKKQLKGLGFTATEGGRNFFYGIDGKNTTLIEVQLCSTLPTTIVHGVKWIDGLFHRQSYKEVEARTRADLVGLINDIYSHKTGKLLV